MMPRVENLSLLDNELKELNDQTNIFALSKVQFEWKGNLVDLCVHNNILLMALDTGRVLRIDLAQPAQVEQIDVASQQDQIQRVFLDFTGRHALISTNKGDNYYLHQTWKRPKLLQKLRSFPIACVAWCRDKQPFSRRNGVNKAASGPLLVGGSQNSLIYEIELDPSEELFRREERYTKVVYNGFEGQKITGLAYDCLSQTDFGVFVTVENRLYQFRGQINTVDSSLPCFERLFSKYIDDSSKLTYQELPGDFNNANLRLQYQALSSTDDLREQVGLQSYQSPVIGAMKGFAWLTAPGVYHGNVGIDEDDPSVVHNAQLLPYPAQIDSATQQFVVPAPLSMVPTEFHFILVFKDRIKTVCRLNDEIVWDCQLSADLNNPVNIIADEVKGTYWVFTQSSLYEIVVDQEDRNIWMLYLQKNQFQQAFNHAKTPLQKDLINVTQADYYFKQGRFLLAAKYYAESSVSLEQASLKFLVKDGPNELNDTMHEALKTYLQIKLKQIQLSKNQIQKTLITTWLLEVWLKEIDQMKRRGQTDSDTEKAVSRFREWLADGSTRASLDTQTVYSIFANFDCPEEMISYAITIGDFSKVIKHYIEQRQYKTAIDYLLQQKSPDVVYNVAPLLMEFVPYESVTLFIRSPYLKPSMLIPALLRYEPSKHGHDDSSAERENQVLRYLEYCVYGLHNTDTAIHNLLLSLYVSKPINTKGEDVLLKYLRRSDQHYELQYALRLCTQHQRLHACVLIYGSLGMYEDAVTLALKYDDIDLAQKYADLSEEIILKRRLWIRICQHVIEVKKSVKSALKLAISTDVLNIEDILPFFPVDIAIGEFKEEFCEALDSYKSEVYQMKEEMSAAAESAESIRQDLRSLKQQFAKVSPFTKCNLCDKVLLSNPFYVFPCGHKFHAPCLVVELLENHFTPKLCQMVVNLQEQAELFRKEQQSQRPLTGSTQPVNMHQEQLDDLLSSDCPICGDLAVKTIDKPFPLDLVAWLK